MSTTQALERYTIDLLIRQERRYRDTQQWTALRSCWHPDTTQTHVSISFITGTVEDWINGNKRVGASSTSLVGPFHTIEPKEILINDEGDRALATSLISIHMRFEHKGVVFDVVSWAHQIQRFVKLDGEWQITRFEAIYIRDELKLPWPQEAATKGVMREVGKEIKERGGRECVRVLGWQLGLGGVEVKEDLAGYDEEGTWRGLVEGGRGWLKGGI